MTIVNLWVDSSIVGCGERLFVVIKTGTKFVHLFNPAQLKGIQVERAEFERYAKPSGLSPHTVHKFLRAKAREYRQFGLHYSAKAVKAAEAVLEDAHA